MRSTSWKRFLLVPFLCLPASRAAIASDWVASEAPSKGLSAYRLLQQARASSPERARYAEEAGATARFTDDGRSFLLLWLPRWARSPADVPMIVTLHGHGSWAYDELFLWRDAAERRGYGVLALQWWFGRGESPADYYEPREVYPLLERLLRGAGVPAGRTLLHGFSRGSANLYGVVALDRTAGSRLFALAVANAGGASSDFPVNAEVDRGVFGPAPFAGSRWVTACGARDPNPDRDGCPAMRRTGDWIRRLGGTVELAIEDPDGGHGAFHRNPANVESALDAFARLLAGPTRR